MMESQIKYYKNDDPLNFREASSSRDKDYLTGL